MTKVVVWFMCMTGLVSKDIEVDTQANRWRFSYFADDQSNDPDAWTGGSGLMDLTPCLFVKHLFPNRLRVREQVLSSF